MKARQCDPLDLLILPEPHTRHTSKRTASNSQTKPQHSSLSTPQRTHNRHGSSASAHTPNLENHTKRIQEIMAHSIAPRTAANYDSAVKSFSKFCQDNHLCELPADEFTLCAFAAHLAQSQAGSSIANTISGLKHWHNRHGARWQGGPQLDLVLRGARTLTPKHTQKPKRPPVSLEMLEILANTLDRDNPLDGTILTAALVAFFGMARLGELLGTSSRYHDPSKLPPISSIGPKISDKGSRTIHLPSTKTSQTNGEDIVITSQPGPVDPILALNKLIDRNKNLSRSAFLFSYTENRSARVKNLTSELFLNRINEIWSRHKYPRVTGHCFRIGGTTFFFFLRAGTAPEVVKMMGRWSSDAFYRYWRETHSIIIEYAEHTVSKRQKSQRTRSQAPLAGPGPNCRARTSRKGHRPY